VIVNIASSAGFAAAPQMAAYNVTKAGVISLSETLAAELGSSGIQVTVAMPGFFRTGLLSTLRAPAAETAYARQLLERARHGPDAAAAAVLTAAANGRLHLVWPREYAVLWRMKRWFPRWFVGRVRRLRELQIRRAADRPRV
jgi:short-subunit dehydrogenase